MYIYLESVSVSGLLHDNSSQLHSIVLKFCAHNCLINISVEFEDKKDPREKDWFIEKLLPINVAIPEITQRFFLKKFLRII